MKLIVGLGNPGPRYAHTRHNIGFLVAERLAADAGIALKRQGYQGIYGTGRLAGCEATILLPQTYMNLSGVSVAAACKSLGVPPGDLVVIHDDLDLSFGVLRLKAGGGHGGHNGIRSISEKLGDSSYLRLKFGVGRPNHPGAVADYVLSAFSGSECAGLDERISLAAEALETVLRDGLPTAMNRFNSR